MPIQPVSGEIKAQPLNDNFSFLDSKVDQVSGGPKETFISESALKSKYPNGSNSAMLVLESDGKTGYLYTWNGTMWSKGLLYQSQGVADGQINVDKTDFAKAARQYYDESDQIAGKYWVRQSDNNIYLSNGSNTIAYPAIELKAGTTYSIYNARGYFSFLTSTSGQMISRLDSSDLSGVYEVTPVADCELRVSKYTADPVTKVFNISKNELSKLNIDIANVGVEYLATKIDKLKIDQSNIAERSVEANQTLFATDATQYVDQTEWVSGKYYTINASTNTITTNNSANALIYPAIRLKAGEYYSVFNIRGYFSYITDINNKILQRISTTDIVANTEFQCVEEGYLYITRYAVDNYSAALNCASKYILDDPKLIPAGYYRTTIPNIEDVLQYSHKQIIVGTSAAAQYTKLTDALASITKTSKELQYDIYLESGVYDIYAEFGGIEFINQIEANPSRYGEQWGIRLPDYVNIYGIEDVTIKFEVPNNESTLQSSTRISTLNVNKNNHLENLTLTARNTRYVVHDETNNQIQDTSKSWKNVHFIHLGNAEGMWKYSTAYGCGTGSNGRYLFENCKFVSTTYGLGVHDNRDQKKNIVCLNNCEFEGGTVPYDVRFTTYGNGVEIHEVIMNNCKMSKGIETREEVSGSDAGNRWKISGGGNTKAPYKNINATGEKLRIEFADETARLENVGVDLQAGNVVKLSGIGKCTKIGTDENFLFYGVSLENTVQGERALIKYSGFLNRSDTPISSLAAGDRVGIVEGNLAKVSTGEYVGYAIDNENILFSRGGIC